MVWKLSICLLFSKSFIRNPNDTDVLANNRRYKNAAKLQLQSFYRNIHKSSITLSRGLLPQIAATSRTIHRRPPCPNKHPQDAAHHTYFADNGFGAAILR
jgi:hypothetical protein